MIVTKLSDSKRINLTDFGIEIPLLYDRATSILNDIPQKAVEINPKILKATDIGMAHTRPYVDALFGIGCVEKIMETFELKNSDGTFNRFNPKNAKRELSELFPLISLEAAAVCETARIAYREGAALYLGGGMHHAMSFKGGGFCLINDIVIALRMIQKEELITESYVIDVDAHKGDGTAEITFTDSSISTLSIHMAHGWPLNTDDKNSPSKIQSTIDIPIAQGEEGKYIFELRKALPQLVKGKGKDRFAVVVAGADPFIHDELPSSSELNLDLETLLERDLLIYNFLKEREIPQLWLLAGGYGPEVYKVTSQFLKAIHTL